MLDKDTLTDRAHVLLSTAIESGIAYWCLIERYDWKDDAKGRLRVAPVKGWEQNDQPIADFDGKEPQFTVGARQIVQALKRMRDDKCKTPVPAHWRKFAASFLVADTDYDAIGADVVFQYAALNDLVYG